jgi:hypothetical protein
LAGIPVYTNARDGGGFDLRWLEVGATIGFLTTPRFGLTGGTNGGELSKRLSGKARRPLELLADQQGSTEVLRLG